MAVQCGVGDRELEGRAGNAAAPVKMSTQGGQEKGFAKGTGKGFPGKGTGPKGGNAYPYFK